MDNLLRHAVQEIALEGLQGTSFVMLLNRLKELEQISTVFNLEDPFVRDKLWKAVVETPEIMLYIKQDKPAASSTEITNEGYLPIEEQGRKQLSKEEATTISFDPHHPENFESYKLVADFAVRASVLGYSRDVFLSELQFCILELAGKSREKGVMQTEISKTMNIEPKTTMYHLLRLENIQAMYVYFF